MTLVEQLRNLAKHGLKDSLVNQAANEIEALTARVAELGKKADEEMLRVKACEHIAEGEPGWERLRNECPSTAAVASLRDYAMHTKEVLVATGKMAREAIELNAIRLEELEMASRSHVNLVRALDEAIHTLKSAIPEPYSRFPLLRKMEATLAEARRVEADLTNTNP